MKKYSRGIFSFHWFSNIIITDNGQKTNEKEIEIESESDRKRPEEILFFSNELNMKKNERKKV